MASYNAIVLHRVVEGQSKSFIDITTQTLRHILKESMAIGELVLIDQAAADSQHNRRKIGLTFDDGFSSDHDLVLPELKRIKAVATFFIVTDWLETPGYLTKRQVRNLSDAGMQIGSHSKSHPNFLTISDQERLNELRQSKLVLENIIDKEISTFAFPFGFFDEACTKAVFDANYSICCTSAHGLSSSSSRIVSRNSINAHTSLNRIKKILRSGMIQRILWYFEDAIKRKMKQSFPRSYIVIRNLFSSV